ncbi:LiaF domain-containing protein [Clostridium sp. Marseille-P299]|uniref:LiaF domain-containing protein n=1 Tax=Clostridium sp. Marseille-P299 TaxID=1805477 RepID=UPI00082FE22A|nr:LiaF domain-containing protein [Clostridium sp. Marseille-P299]
MCKNCKKNTIMEFIPTKKKSKGHKVIKAVMAVIAINGALKLYSMYRENKDNEKGKNEGNEVKVYKACMTGREIKLDGEKVQGIFIKAYMSGVDLDLRNAIITEDIFITCKSIMSGISIRVPHGVNVELDGKCVLGSMDSSVPEALEKVGPTVYVDANLMLSGLAVQAGKKQSKDSEKTNEEDSIFEEESFEESLEEIQEESEQDLKEASSEESEENTSE